MINVINISFHENFRLIIAFIYMIDTHDLLHNPTNIHKPFDPRLNREMEIKFISIYIQEMNGGH